jgi:hypothetical protein
MIRTFGKIKLDLGKTPKQLILFLNS